jgi:hypothetical protein
MSVFVFDSVHAECAGGGQRVETKPFIEAIATSSSVGEEGNLFAGIWASYEKVVLHGIITSFGLDFLVHDQRGGDVDTIHSVRESGIPVERTI